MTSHKPIVQTELVQRCADVSVDSISEDGFRTTDDRENGLPTGVQFEPVNIISYPQQALPKSNGKSNKPQFARSLTKVIQSEHEMESNFALDPSAVQLENLDDDEELRKSAKKQGCCKWMLSDEQEEKKRQEMLNSFDILDEHIEGIRQICQDTELLEKEFSFDCINQVYFLEQIEENKYQLGKEETEHLQNAKLQLMHTNRHLYKQYEIFKHSLAILNFLIPAWNIEKEANINFDHKYDASLDVIRILNTEEVQKNIISIDILWMTCENSPLRYMYDELIDKIPTVQVELMALMNILANIAINPQSNARTFVKGTCDVLNFGKLARLRKKTLARLTQYVQIYRKFEKKVLLQLYKLTAQYYENANRQLSNINLHGFSSLDTQSKMATESLAPYRENVRYHLAKQKLQENFLKWLTMPSTTQLINKLVDDCQRNVLNQIVPPSPLFHPRTPASPQVNSPNRNTLTPPLSPSAPDKLNLSPGHARESSSPVQEMPRPSLDPSNQIPQFYFPKGKPTDSSVMEKELSRINEIFVAESQGVDEFKDITQHICNLPRCVSRILFSRIKGSLDGTVSKKEFLTWYEHNLLNKNANQRFFAVTKKPGTNYLERDDFRPYMRELLDSHPGLEFLKATPEFQERYTDSVLERIFYTVDQNDDAKISLRDLNRSNLVTTFIGLDEEEDINRVRDFFSYEHFYVLYCRFWELDSDHDFIIDKEDFARYEGHSLSKKAIDRIFEQIPRPFQCDQEGKMKYEDFVWFMLSEEDKTTTRSLEYWFKLIDLDANGVITPYEMEHFYSEQLHRLEYLNHDVVLFNDILCQMTDMIKPAKENWFVLEDFKRTHLISGTFFNILVNLNKFIAYEQRDPFSIKAEQNENPDYSEWDKFAATEYVRLALEEENAENEEMLDDIDPWDSDHEDQASV